MNDIIIIDETNATSSKLHTWTTEASTLGFRPGQVATRLQTTLGNGQPFVLVHVGSDRFLYRQDAGCLGLIVWND